MPLFFVICRFFHIYLVRQKTKIMFKKGLKGSIWVGKGFKIEIKEENKDILKNLGADVFTKGKAKESEDNK